MSLLQSIQQLSLISSDGDSNNDSIDDIVNDDIGDVGIADEERTAKHGGDYNNDSIGDDSTVLDIYIHNGTVHVVFRH